jgi:predicted O-methyltransferase YrrM
VTPHSVITADTLNELMEEARRAPAGDFVEVGVYQGGSLAALAQVARERGGTRVFGFDTFTGIPFRAEGVDHHKVGDFSDTSIEAVRAAVPEAVLVQGVFPDTLTDDVGPIAVAHVDCDQYQSVRDCCAQLEPRMATGGVMVFDDPDCLTGAAVAVREWFGEDRIEISPRGKWRVRF